MCDVQIWKNVLPEQYTSAERRTARLVRAEWRTPGSCRCRRPSLREQRGRLRDGADVVGYDDGPFRITRAATTIIVRSEGCLHRNVVLGSYNMRGFVLAEN